MKDSRAVNYARIMNHKNVSHGYNHSNQAGDISEAFLRRENLYSNAASVVSFDAGAAAGSLK